ncbi:helix-turn-helix domain-containing protein [Serratia marcescens]|nr:helix-turn-helix domain-containing protein [Serratia marcescens]WLS89290.1 helix-turn-helix domain-containing protein [Serratia marcescens]
MSKSPDLPTVSLALCGLAQAADLLGDRWTLLILRESFYGVRRFEELRENIGASRQALSNRLNAMVEQELLAKRAYREPGERERHEYVLTDKGRSLGPILVALMAWGHRHILHDPPTFNWWINTAGCRCSWHLSMRRPAWCLKTRCKCRPLSSPGLTYPFWSKLDTRLI